MEIPGEGTQLTDSNGYYLFENVGSGTLTPTKPAFCFEPESRTYSPDYSYSYTEYRDQDFLASQTCSSISGVITSSDSNPLASVSVELSGDGSDTTLSDANGNYLFSELINGTYTITPSPFDTTPLSRTVTVDLSDVTGQDFVITGRAISGRVGFENGTGVPGITISLSGAGTASTMTDTSGAYSFSGLINSGSYTITSSTTCSAYTFNLPSITVDLVDTDITGQDFTVSAPFSITGNVFANGNPLAGIELTRNGTGVTTATTDVNGMYSFTQVEGSVTYSIKPSSSDYLFSPVERNITTCDQVVAEQNFSGTTTWARAYQRFTALALDITPDGDYILVGSGVYGQVSHDAWILKINDLGKVLWQKRYDFADAVAEQITSVQVTSDGGYIMAGTFRVSITGDNFWVLRLDSSGNILWQKSYVGAGYESRAFIQATSDGGYVMSGNSGSLSDGYEAIVIRLDSSGNILWQKSYSGFALPTYHYEIHQTSDDGYILAGDTTSFGAASSDLLLLKLDSAGDILWQKIYGGTRFEYESSVQQTADGGYILTGITSSFGAGIHSLWLLKLDSAGDIQWQKTYGGTGQELHPSILQTIDGGYILVGDTTSFGAGSRDLLLLKLDSNGNVVQEKTYGTAGNDLAVAIKETSDGGYIFLGNTGNSQEATVIKTDSTGNLDFCGLTGSPTVTVTNSSVSAVNSSSTVADTLLTITDTTVVPQEGVATEIQVCPSL